MKLVKKNKEIRREEIFSKISSYDVYRYYFGEFTINRKYLNHLRGDKKQPSFCIHNRYEDLTHIDFGDDYWRGDCVNFVMQLHRCDYLTALLTIDKDFNLGIADNSVDIHPEKIITWKKPIIAQRKEVIIQAITQKFTKIQLDWWNAYELSEDDLKKDYGGVTIHSIKTYYLNKDKMPVEDLTFGYLFEGKYWKIYKPVNKEAKWMTNCPINVCYGLSNVSNCNVALGLKSVKDLAVSYKFLSPCSFGVQNESSVAISDESINYITENSKERYLIFDADKKGVESSMFYNSKGFGYWNVPKRYYTQYGIKDPSDFVYRYGGERLRKEVSKKIQL